MFRQRTTFLGLSQRTAFFIVFGLITLVLVGGSLGLVGWIATQLQSIARADAPDKSPASALYVNYDPADTDRQYLRPESLAAMTKYTQENPEPQNVQILKGMTTGQIANYMVSQVSGGLRVDCSYCHNLANGNFADDSNPQKNVARGMMQMAADLNQNWIKLLPASVGEYQVTCATCHNGRPAPIAYPLDQSPLPDDYRLPLENLDVLLITGKEDPSLGAVQVNQWTMSHMNNSLGVGCNFCHNANYFPSNEVANKGYALTMLKMVQHINNTYSKEGGGDLLNQTPSCNTCHQGNPIPPGAAKSPADVPAVLSSNPPGATTSTTCLVCHPAVAVPPDTAGATGNAAADPRR